MTLRVPADPDQLDSLHVETRDVDRVLEALLTEAGESGLAPIDATELAPFGRWLHGDEDPSVRRYLVSPPGRRWTTVLSSMTDWDRDLVRGLARRLDTRCVSLMLHDDDVLSLALWDGPDSLVDHVSSPEHFDLPSRPAGTLDVDLDALLTCCRPGTTRDALREALTVPGRIDVDGRASMEAMVRLLELEPRWAMSCYRAALGEDERTPAGEYAEWNHLAFRELIAQDEPSMLEHPSWLDGDGREHAGRASSGEGRASDGDRGKLLEFPGPRTRPRP